MLTHRICGSITVHTTADAEAQEMAACLSCKDSTCCTFTFELKCESVCCHVHAGGHGIAWDGPFSTEIMRVVETAFAAGKVIGAVCHGPAALVSAKIIDPSHPLYGQSILAGKQVRHSLPRHVLIERVHQSKQSLDFCSVLSSPSGSEV